MLVKCIKNKIEEVADSPVLFNYLKENEGYGNNLGRYLIEKEKIYCVKALKVLEQGILFFISDDGYDITQHYYSDFFEIVDEIKVIRKPTNNTDIELIRRV